MPYFDKKKTRWRGEVQVKDPSGKTIRKTKLFDTKREAAKWEMEASEGIKHPVKSEKETATPFSAAYSEYLDWCEHRYSRNTFVEKRALGQRVVAFFQGDRDMQDITPKGLNDFLIESARAVSNNRANRDRKNLMAFFTWGNRVLGFAHNPISALDKLPHHRKEQYVPMPNNIRQLLLAATRTERAFLQCYLQTAARRSEVLRWKWGEDVDFEARRVRLGTMKTKDGSMEYIWMPMSQELYDELRWWWKNREDREAEYVWTVPEGPHQGEKYTTRRKFMKGLCERAGVKPFGFHGLRRYAASLLAARGVPMKMIQGILRHGSMSTTERYVKRLSENLRGTVELLATVDGDGDEKGSAQS